MNRGKGNVAGGDARPRVPVGEGEPSTDARPEASAFSTAQRVATLGARLTQLLICGEMLASRMARNFLLHASWTGSWA